MSSPPPKIGDSAPAAKKPLRGNAGKGRKPGVPNKVTQSAREGIALLVEQNVPKMAKWLDSIEKQHGPLVAMKTVQDLLEYHIPKLQRSEQVGDGGGPITVVVKREA